MSEAVIAPLDLPESIASRVEMHPVEDLILHVLWDAFPDMKDDIVSLLPQNVDTHYGLMALIRRADAQGVWDGDDRFIDYAGLEVHVYASGIDADEKAAHFSEAIRVALRDAWRNPVYYKGLGQLKKVHLTEEPRRRTDWMPSAGPVQYADLPGDWTRYQAKYGLYIRRPVWG